MLNFSKSDEDTNSSTSWMVCKFAEMFHFQMNSSIKHVNEYAAPRLWVRFPGNAWTKYYWLVFLRKIYQHISWIELCISHVGHKETGNLLIFEVLSSYLLVCFCSNGPTACGPWFRTLEQITCVRCPAWENSECHQRIQHGSKSLERFQPANVLCVESLNHF